VVGAALVQLSAEGWATRWQPAATLGGSSLVGRLRIGTAGS
jgi:coenzyme F420-0:L-glutamate ligase/coenzyme F420-1:gamma-L-glutamate ligase